MQPLEDMTALLLWGMPMSLNFGQSMNMLPGRVTAGLPGKLLLKVCLSLHMGQNPAMASLSSQVLLGLALSAEEARCCWETLAWVFLASG